MRYMRWSWREFCECPAWYLGVIADVAEADARRLQQR